MESADTGRGEGMINNLLILLLLAATAGIAGMLGLKKKKVLCLIFSALALPVLVFLALWTGAGLERAACCLCVMVLFVLSGLPEVRKEEK